MTFVEIVEYWNPKINKENYIEIAKVVDDMVLEIKNTDIFERVICLKSSIYYKYVLNNQSLLFNKGIFSIILEISMNTKDMPACSLNEDGIALKVYMIEGDNSASDIISFKFFGCYYSIINISDKKLKNVYLLNEGTIIYDCDMSDCHIKNIYTDMTMDSLLKYNFCNVKNVNYIINMLSYSEEESILELIKYFHYVIEKNIKFNIILENTALIYKREVDTFIENIKLKLDSIYTFSLKKEFIYTSNEKFLKLMFIDLVSK